MLEEFSIFWPLFGGLLIGVSITLLLLLNGHIAGISGIIFSLFSSLARLQFTVSKDLWRILFLIGLVVGAALFHFVSGEAKPDSITALPLPIVIAGGILVGFGTKLGAGCTSGHGICGIARFSTRSIISTIVFMTAGVVSVYVFRHVLGLG